METDNEVKEIFDLLGKPSGFRSIISALYSNDIEKYSLASMGFFVIIFALLNLCPALSIYSWKAIVAVALFAILYFLAMFLGQIRYILTPLKSYFSELAIKFEQERKIVKELSEYSSESISAAKKRILFQKEMLEGRVGFLLGVIDKLGIVPAVIILYLTYAKTMNDPFLESIPPYVLSALAGLYIGGFLARAVTSKLALMAVLLEEAYVISSQKSSPVIYDL